MNKVFFKIAFQNLKGRPLRSWLTILGIVIGVFLVVSLLSLSEGLKGSIMHELKMMGGDLIMVMPGDTGSMVTAFISGNELTRDNIEAIRRAEGVDAVVPTAWAGEVVRYKDTSQNVFIFGSPWETSVSIYQENMGWSLVEGQWPEPNRRQAIVGSLVVQDLLPGLKTGDRIKIRGQSFEVTGILRSLGSKQDDSMVALDWSDFQSVFGRQDGSPMVVAQINQSYSVEQVEENIRLQLESTQRRTRQDETPAFSIITSDKAADMVGNIMGIIQLAVFFFAGIAVLVGAIGITNTMYTSVYERTKEIGILKAVGAKRKDIISIFLIESVIIGFAGGLIGVILGSGLAWSVQYIIPRSRPLFYIQPTVTLLLIFFGLLFAAGVGGLAGYFPARRGANLRPVQALRYE